MKSLFNTAENREIIDRIERLSPASQAKWGTMDAAQMLFHVQQPLRVAFGELRLKLSVAGFFFDKIAKRKLSNNEPWGRGLPTDKHFIVVDRKNFADEKGNLLVLVLRFVDEGRGGIINDLHPFFGRLTTDEWDRLMWNHLDHHLRQFGV
jgi:hypothetical protein